jgi:hypothetical protein
MISLERLGMDGSRASLDGDNQVLQLDHRRMLSIPRNPHASLR